MKTGDGRTVDCKLKGNLRIKGLTHTNPVAVGDNVELIPSAEGAALITAICPRSNYIIRRSQNMSKQSHIIAANVDQAMLVVTVNHPEISLTFIDRFLASAEAYSVPVVLVFNKTDLLSPEEHDLQEMIMHLYDVVGYRCVAISAQTGEGVDDLLPLMKRKITLLSGNSGVGKSTLINCLIPGAQLRTAEISDTHGTGMHTTTFSQMLEFQPEGEWGAIIDTPGIKGFGSFDIKPEEISSYFKEIFRFSKGCRFHNCTHIHEPGCAVLKALDEHLIAQSRYNSYVSMMQDSDGDKYRPAY